MKSFFYLLLEIKPCRLDSRIRDVCSPIEFLSPAIFMANCHEHFQTSYRDFVCILDLGGPSITSSQKDTHFPYTVVRWRVEFFQKLINETPLITIKSTRVQDFSFQTVLLLYILAPIRQRRPYSYFWIF